MWLGLLFSCSRTHFDPPAPPPEGWKESLLAFRERVDEFFASEESPLDSALVESFTGLRYFPPDPAYRFAARLDTRGSGASATLLDTKGGIRSYVVHARVHLQTGTDTFTLTLYRTPDSPHLFLPFQDGTTGKETYVVGRYLDLALRPDNTVVVDFNFAKNPYCAYSDKWSCPLVPEENQVAVPIRAGEKTYPRHTD